MTAEIATDVRRIVQRASGSAFVRAWFGGGKRRPVELASPARARLLAVLPVLFVVSFFYVFLGSAGHFTDLPIAQTSYYDRLAEGFREGHLYMIDEPEPALLRQENPFAAHNLSRWIWDASLYRGHYYLYFGPVPALLIASFRWATGYEGVLTDQWPTILFLLGRLYAGAGLLLGVFNKAKWPPPIWLCVLCVAVFGLAHPVPYIAMRPNVWETALAGGQCFLFVGLWLAFVASSASRYRRLLLISAGTMWGLAIGCRATMAIPAPLLMCATVGLLWYVGRRGLAILLDAVSIGAPFAVLCVLHGWYNWARFESPLEFGITYQTTLQPFRTNAGYVLPNLFAYFVTPLAGTCKFPFVILPAGRQMPSFIGHPPGYATFEQLGGLTSLVPWIWLIPLGAGWLLFRRRDPLVASPPLSAHEIWLACAGLLITPALIPVLHLWVAAPRYPGDAIGGLVFLGSIAAAYFVRAAAGPAGIVSKIIGLGIVPALGIATCIISALTAFAISTRTFPLLNPVLYHQIEAILSICPPDPEQVGRF